MLTAWTKAEFRSQALHASERINSASGYPRVDDVLRDAEKIAAFIIYEPVLIKARPAITRVRARRIRPTAKTK